MKIYISGRISNINLNLARSRFIEAEQMLLSVGFDEVFNPMSVQGKFSTWEQYMKHDIIELMKCDCIYMLDGWELSRGARIEHSIMEALKLPILYESERSMALSDEVKRIVAESCHISIDELVSKSRKRYHFFARMITAAALRECKYSIARIGRAVNRDHATVLYMLNQHPTELEYNAEYREMYDAAIYEIDKQGLFNLFQNEV